MRDQSAEQGHAPIVEPEFARFVDFQVLDMLGEGSFGKVFKVKKKSTGN